MTKGFILKADQLVAGDGSPPVKNPTVLIEKSKIKAITSFSEIEAIAQDYQIIDLPNTTLLPGLIDCHVHLNFPADGSPILDINNQSDPMLSAISMNNARKALEAGITSLRDCGGRQTLNLELRNAIEMYNMALPRLISCGPPITLTGGHCWFFGAEAEGADNLRRKVRELIKQGVDFIKVMAAGGGTPSTLAWQPTYTQEELNTIVEEAHKHDLKTSAHCLNAESTLQAVKAGFDQIEHAGFLIDANGNQNYDPKVAEALVRAQVKVCPTLAVGRYVIKYLEAFETPTQQDKKLLERWYKMLEKNVANLAHLIKEGVNLVAGTDAGWRWTPFNSLVDELELMSEAGLSNYAAVESATSVAATSLGMSEHIGTLKPNMNADIVAIQGDPIQDLASLRKVKLVMKGGEIACYKV